MDCFSFTEDEAEGLRRGDYKNIIKTIESMAYLSSKSLIQETISKIKQN